LPQLNLGQIRVSVVLVFGSVDRMNPSQAVMSLLFIASMANLLKAKLRIGRKRARKQ
jgi:hypothetical protein